jgi:uncharacterized membrane protein
MFCHKIEKKEYINKELFNKLDLLLKKIVLIPDYSKEELIVVSLDIHLLMLLISNILKELLLLKLTINSLHPLLSNVWLMEKHLLIFSECILSTDNHHGTGSKIIYTTIFQIHMD